jgi:hypothetical protein
MIDCVINIGASVAVSSFSGATVQSVVRASTGVYTITLQPQTNFVKLYSAASSMQSPPSGLSGIMAVEIQNAPSTSVATATGAVLTIKTLDLTGALANPASGSAIKTHMICSQSSVILPGE